LDDPSAKFLPWPLESYINGVHIFKEPQPWLFPLFPWSAFAFAGLAVDFFCFRICASQGRLAFAALGGAGIVACYLSVLFDSSRVRLYAVYDYWHSNPDFLLMRGGTLLMILFLVYAWCRWEWRRRDSVPSSSLEILRCGVLGAHRICLWKIFHPAQGQCSALKATAG